MKKSFDEIVKKLNGKTVFDVLNDKVSDYKKEDLVKDLNFARQQLKGRFTRLDTFNKELSKELGMTGNEMMIQQTKLRNTTLMNTANLHKLSKDSSNRDITTMFNSLLFDLSDEESRNTSKLAGKGGIYEQQAKFLNLFGFNIKTNKTYLERNTNKGIRTDIINAYKHIQGQMGNAMDIEFLKNFWSEYSEFKEKVGMGHVLQYGTPEEGRKLLRDFASLYKLNGYKFDANLMDRINQSGESWRGLEKVVKQWNEDIENQKQAELDNVQDDIETQTSSDLTINATDGIDDVKDLLKGTSIFMMDEEDDGATFDRYTELKGKGRHRTKKEREEFKKLRERFD